MIDLLWLINFWFNRVNLETVLFLHFIKFFIDLFLFCSDNSMPTSSVFLCVWASHISLQFHAALLDVFILFKKSHFSSILWVQIWECEIYMIILISIFREFSRIKLICCCCFYWNFDGFVKMKFAKKKNFLENSDRPKVYDYCSVMIDCNRKIKWHTGVYVNFCHEH